MADIEKILDSLNLPKQLLDKSEALLKTLFGPSFDEVGGILADNVKLRRFKNQIKIFSKAQEILKENKIDPKKVSLKVLAPLIEYSSYEEEESLQEKWSRLTAQIVINSKDVVFYQNCISILNKLSTDDATLLDELFERLNNRRREIFDKQERLFQHTIMGESIALKPDTLEGYALEKFSFYSTSISKTLNRSRDELHFQVSNLTALGLLKWETSVEVKAERSSEEPDDKDIDVDVDVYNNDDFIFTPLGYRFVKICYSDPKDF